MRPSQPFLFMDVDLGRIFFIQLTETFLMKNDPTQWTEFFLMLVLPRRTSFLTTFYGLYFSHHSHITNYNLSHVGPLCTAFMYCINTCLSDLWADLLVGTLLNYLFSMKNSHPCRDFEPGTSPVPS